MEKNKKFKIGGLILALLLVLLVLVSCITKATGKKDNPLSVDPVQTNNTADLRYDPEKAISSEFSGAVNPQGKVTYSLIEAKDSNGKDVDYFYLASDTDTRIIAGPATPSGLYTLKIQVDAQGNDEYESASKVIEYTFVINKAKTSYVAPTGKENLTYTGKPQDLVSAGSASTGTLLYKVNEGEWSKDLPTGTEAGIYTVYYKIEGDENHEDVDEQHFFVTIARKQTSSYSLSTGSSLSIASIKLPSSAYSADDFFNKERAGSKPSQHVTTTYNGHEQSNGYYAPDGIIMTGMDRGIDAGDYVAVYTPDLNHCWSDGSFGPVLVRLTINKATPKAVISRYETPLVYNGQPQQLLKSAETDGGTLMFRLGESGLWQFTIPTATKAGDYKVYVRVIGDRNYRNLDPIEIEVSIKAAALAIPQTVSTVYNGLPQKATGFVGFDAQTMKVVSNPYHISAGDYEVEIMLKDTENYVWEDGSIENKLVPWTISKLPIEVPYIKGDAEFDYNGIYHHVVIRNEHTLAPYVSREGQTIAVNAGEYKVTYTITDGNHCWQDFEGDTYELTWKINKIKAYAANAPKALELVYNGKEQTLILAGFRR